MWLSPQWDPCSTFFFLLDIEVLDSDEGRIVRWTVWDCVYGRSRGLKREIMCRCLISLSQAGWLQYL